MFVDDEKSYTDLMTQMLGDALDCRVYGFTRPLDALRALPTIDPSVIVTDYFMPQLDGLDFIEQATQIAPRATFVMISGHNLAVYESRMARLTALKGFLAKPFGWKKLADEIMRVWPADVPAQATRSGADATSV